MSRNSRIATPLTLGIALAALTACVADSGDRQNTTEDGNDVKVLAEAKNVSPVVPTPRTSATTVDADKLGARRKDDNSSLVMPAGAPSEQDTRTNNQFNATHGVEQKPKKNEAQRHRQLADLSRSPAMANESVAIMQHAAQPNNALVLPAPIAPSRAEFVDRENYAHLDESAIKSTAKEPVSTFSVDVDTGAYANVRRFLNSQRLPPQDAVRIEEMINYFNYSYPTPTDPSTPFSVTTEIATTPWNADTLLMQVGLKGYEIAHSERPATNLSFSS